MIKLLAMWLNGGKTNTAMLAIIAAYCLKTFLGVDIPESEIAIQAAIVLGAIGQLHKVWKSDTTKKIVKAIKNKKSK